MMLENRFDLVVVYHRYEESPSTSRTRDCFPPRSKSMLSLLSSKSPRSELGLLPVLVVSPVWGQGPPHRGTVRCDSGGRGAEHLPTPFLPPPPLLRPPVLDLALDALHCQWDVRNSVHCVASRAWFVRFRIPVRRPLQRIPGAAYVRLGFDYLALSSSDNPNIDRSSPGLSGRNSCRRTGNRSIRCA